MMTDPAPPPAPAERRAVHPRGGGRRKGRRTAQGFTLIELAIVVLIIGVLSAIAIPSFTAYMHRSKVTEAVSFLGEIKARQESYRAEFGQYADVSTAGCGMFIPTAVPANGDPVAWTGAGTAWDQLGANPDGQVRFRYCTFAGPPGMAPMALGFTGNDFWFVSRAEGDLDGDSMNLTLEGYSAARHIWVSEAKGWE